MALKNLLDEISVIPGVTGSCIFNRKEGPLCTNTDSNIATDVLLKVGSFLVRMLKMGKMQGLEIVGSHYRFDNCTVVSTPLDQDSILLTICDTKANCSLVATTAAMLAADMDEQMQKGAAVAVIPGKDELDFQLPEVEDQPPTVTDLQQSFFLLEEALTEAIGPVAGMILQDSIVQWQKHGRSDASRLKELVAMLLGEIDDDDLIIAFKKKVRKIL